MPPTSPAPFNIASLLSQAAAQDPQKTAVHCPQSPDCRGQASLTFAALDQDSSTVAAGLLSLGLDPGDRVAVALRPGIDFYVVIFALFKAGLIPVMVDPGVGARRALQCLAESRPQGLVGIPLAHAASLIFPGYFKNVRTRVTLGRTLGWGGSTVLKLLRKGAPLINPVPTLASDPAAILFTSGATGPPKGVLYTHAMFRAQVEAIRNNFPLPPGGVELVTFPLFGLFTPALSMTSVIADMNSAKPAQADPAKLVSSLSANKVTSLFASPALLRRLAPYCREKKIVLSGLKSVISAGAPVPPSLALEFAAALAPECSFLTPYGATEGMPLTKISAAEIVGFRGMTEQGFGLCLGRPLPECDVKIIPIGDGPLNAFSAKDLLPQGEVGELVAQGPMVAESYFELPQATALSMLLGPDGRPWRRMGDVGWRDAQGHIWFCGRKSQRVTTGSATLHTIPCESIFNNHPLVRRSALVGIGDPGSQRPVVVVEPLSKLRRGAWENLEKELRTLAKANPRTREIFTFLPKTGFPVDVRHNAKINREKLAVWAENALKARAS